MKILDSKVHAARRSVLDNLEADSCESTTYSGCDRRFAIRFVPGALPGTAGGADPVPDLRLGLVDDALFHAVLYVVVLPASGIAFALGYRHHHDRSLILVGGLGLMILGVTAVAGHELFGHEGERWVTSLGGLVLATAHVINYRHSRAKHRH